MVNVWTAGILLAAGLFCFGVESSAAGGLAEDGEDQAEEVGGERSKESLDEVGWEVRFVDSEDRNRFIFRTQCGRSEEGLEIFVDFPEALKGKDGWNYRALEHSPLRFTPSGTGTQKYEVLYRKTGQAPEQPEDEGGQASERLESWIQTAVSWDEKITGSESERWQVVTENQAASRERLKNLISMVHDTERHEVLVIAKDHTPSAVVIGQEFPDVVGISELELDEFFVSDVRYRVVRIGFQRTWEESLCEHRMDRIGRVEPGCLTDGRDEMRCRLCGMEMEVLLPAVGHRDEDGDGLCDICCLEVDGENSPEARHYRIGDVLMKRIGKKEYPFRCIDEDYEGERDHYGGGALFLCDTVIRSDIESDEQEHREIRFGRDNNYKNSEVRAWLRKGTEGLLEDVLVTDIGTSHAYQGATKAGEYEQFSYEELVPLEKPFQLLEDRVFIFSVEEAVKYRDYLWKFNGSGENNPETQYSAHSRAYFLRTPQYKGGEGFEYGEGIYVVDLRSGNLRPAGVSDMDIGIRPAMVIAQGERKEEE